MVFVHFLTSVLVLSARSYCFHWFGSQKLLPHDLQFSSLYRSGMGVLSEERVIRVMIIVNLLILSAGYLKEGGERMWGLKRGQGGVVQREERR